MLLRVVGGPELQAAAAGRHGDLPRQPLVGHVGQLRVDVPAPAVRVERPARLGPARRRPAPELRELRGRQDTARRHERRARVLVVRAAGAVEAPRQRLERVVDAVDVEQVAVLVLAVADDLEEAAEPVLEHVIDEVAAERGAAQQQAPPRVPRRVGRVARTLVLRVVELRSHPRAGVLLAGALAGVEDAAALVHVRARLEHLVEREPVRVAAAPSGLTGDDVVARVPQDGVVVIEHAEVVRRRAVPRVDVVDVRRDAVGRQRVEVVLQVARPRRHRRLHRRGPGVVLRGHDEHAPAGLRDGLVGERLALLAAALEPDLDRVAR